MKKCSVCGAGIACTPILCGDCLARLQSDLAAALADLKRTGDCDLCRHKLVDSPCNFDCDICKAPCHCRNCLNGSRWEWRGRECGAGDMTFIISFPTTTAAMQMQAYAERERLPGRIIPVPRSLSAGCGMAWAAPAENENDLCAAIERFSIQISKTTVMDYTLGGHYEKRD